MYGTFQTMPQTPAGSVIQPHVGADGSMTIIGDESAQQQQQQQQLQFVTSQLPSPMSMLSTIDARQIQQQTIHQQQQRPASATGSVSVTSSRPPSQLSVQLGPTPPPGQQTATVAGFQGLVGQGGTVYGGGAQMMCTTPESAAPSQVISVVVVLDCILTHVALLWPYCAVAF